MMKFGSSFVRGTALSLLRDPGTTARVAGVVLLQRPRELITGNIPGKREVRYAPEEAPGTDRFEALLDEKRIPAPVYGKITWLVDGKRFFPEFERRIASARSSVDVQAYIFDNDDVAVGIADLLKKRS